MHLQVQPSILQIEKQKTNSQDFVLCNHIGCNAIFTNFALFLFFAAPPMIRLSVDDTVVVDPGQDVVITCEVTAGLPSPTVTWSRYPGALPLSAQVRGPTLFLRAVTPADAGFYNCTATNNVGNPARKNVNLTVRSEWIYFVFLVLYTVETVFSEFIAVFWGIRLNNISCPLIHLHHAENV